MKRWKRISKKKKEKRKLRIEIGVSGSTPNTLIPFPSDKMMQ